jgi:mRNA interferase MazF
MPREVISLGRKNRRRKEHMRRLPRVVDIQNPKRMEIWYAKLPMDKRTSVQGGSRPVLIISNDVCNERSSIITVIPMTTQMKHLSQPTHVLLEMEDGNQSMVLAEQIMAIDKRLLDRKIDTCRDEKTITKIEKAVCEQVGIG